MNDPLTLGVVDALHGEGVAFILVGSLSSNLYGIPRSTRDADFVIELGGKSIQSLARRLPPGFHVDPQLEFETVTGTTRNVVTVAGSPFQIELFRLSADSHDQERFQRRIAVEIAGRTLYFPTAEDVIISKLRWLLAARRSKDRSDVRDVLRVQRDRLDWSYLQGWCDQHGTRELLAEILRETK